MRISFMRHIALGFLLVANAIHGAAGQVMTRREAAIASITLTVSEGARDDLIQQAMKFSDAKGFTMRVNHICDQRHFFIELWRADLNITIANPFRDAAQFSIFLYQTTETLVPSTEVDAIISDIKDDIGGITGVVVDTVKK
jgi:hypothetical protein